MAGDSEQRFAQQLKKGVLAMLVLRLLADHPCHGYELIVRLREAGGGLLDLKEGTLYPILYRLEEEGCIASAWSSPDGTKPGKVPRRIYTVTGHGQALLARETELWHTFTHCVEQIIGEETP